MFYWIINKSSSFFDSLYAYWQSDRFVKVSGSILVAVYLVFLLLIGLKRVPLFEDYLSLVPANFFKAIEFAFTLLLFFEVISLVFTIPKSISKSVSIQLEIFSLILLRNAFKIFGNFSGQFTWQHIEQQIYIIFANAFGALIIFLVLMYIRKVERHLSICNSKGSLIKFVRIKKLISLILLIVSAIMIIADVSLYFLDMHIFDFFHTFYTLLIFTDILIVFISLRYSNNYYVIFRNSGYAISTVLLRIALEIPEPYLIIIGLVATLLVLSLVLVYNKAYQLDEKIKDIKLDI
jgi:hypothetical protein